MPPSVTVSGAGSSEVNGNYELMPGKHENRHWGTIAGHYQHTQNPEIFIAFQDCGRNHQRPEWNKWMIISKAGVLYAAHTGGKTGVPPREGVWENVEGWGNPGAPGGKHPAPTVYHPADATTQTQRQLNTDRSSTFASGENILVSEHSLPEYNGIYTIQNNEINGKPWFKNNSGCILYFYNANSGGGPSWSLDDRSQDGTSDWFRGGWIEPPNSGGPPLGTRRWEEAGTIKMESVSIPDESGEPILNSDQKYVFAREEGGWHWHDERARAMGGNLASITSAEENEQVTRIANGNVVWIGGIRKGSGNGPGANHWYWSDGRPWTYTNWHPGEPNNYGGVENRVQLGLGAARTWNDVHEGWSGPAVYELSAETSPATTSVEEKFEFVPVSDYDEVWNDSGSGANQDVSVWRPRVPAGCHLIGMTAKNGHSRPTFPTLVIRAGGRDIAPPERFDLVWWQERGRRRFWCWRPIPPAGYVSLGDVGTTSETPPSRKDVACVALACLSPNRQPLGGQIWNDRGGGAPKDAAFFEQPGGTGLFRCSDDATHNKPRGEFPIPAGASTTPHTTQATNGIEILEAVVGKPVRFRINNRPSSNDAWVGIYPLSASDQDHGEQNKRWKWLRDIDVNNASFPKQAEGDWSIRVFSDGGHTLHERKDFAVKAEPLDSAAVQSIRKTAWIALVSGIIMFGIGLPLFIGGNVGSGEEALGMIIPGAILFSVGALVAGVAWFVLISSWSKSYAESRKVPPKWPKIATVCAALLLIPGASLLIIGLVSSGTIHHEDTASAFLRISDADGLGDQGFIIFIEGTPGDFDSNGIHDYCEAVVVSAHHSGSWMSDPWTATAKWNEADATRQAFELEIAHPGSGCSADVWPEQKGGNLVKIGRACYGCMAGYTDISAYSNDFSYEIPMWIQDGEKVVESTGTWIAGSIMLGISVLSLVGLGIIRSSLRESMAARKDPGTPTIEVLAATEGKSVRFRINDPPSGRSAWVGIYPSAAEDQDHGEEGERWKWLRDMDLKRASFPEKSKGRWSIRVFSDGGFNLDRRVDFDILPEKERWWED